MKKQSTVSGVLAAVLATAIGAAFVILTDPKLNYESKWATFIFAIR